MRGQYGDKKGESVFYATMNKRRKQEAWESDRTNVIKKRLHR